VLAQKSLKIHTAAQRSKLIIIENAAEEAAFSI
jgi:hypothetical protein